MVCLFLDRASDPDGERNDRDLPLSRYGHEEICDGLVLCHLLCKIWARGKAYMRVIATRYLQEVHAGLVPAESHRVRTEPGHVSGWGPGGLPADEKKEAQSRLQLVFSAVGINEMC